MLTSVMGLRKIGCAASQRVRRQLLWFVLVATSVCMPEFVGATHLIGGDLRYRCLGNNQYEIILTYRRDCFTGDPGTEFEDTASIGFFNLMTGAPLQFIGPNGLFRMGRNPIDTATQLFISDCTLAGQDLCVEQTIYIDTITLLPFEPGYKIVYQRCCRNGTLNNVEDPLNTGMTLVAELSFQAQQVCNSSPNLGDYPPIYICVNKDINFDFVATDPDGDSLVFEFFTPFLGASDNFPQPSPPPAPPYMEIEWNDPPYSIDNLLGGIPLTIDRFTGHMSGTPNTIGQFLVGVKIFAYRNGVLIETVTREWQYNVRPCHDTPVSDFLVNTDLNCDSLSISFTEQTQFADEFRWIFDWENNPNSPMSSEMNPTFEFTEPGFYNVALIVNDADSICFDTSFHTVGVFLSEVAADFELDVPSCDESITLDVFDTSQDPDPNYDIASWQYILTDSTGSDTAIVPNPQFFFDEGQEGINLHLTVTSENGCTATFDTTFDVHLLEIDFKGDTSGVCDGDSVALFNAPGNPEFTYIWSPTTDLDLTNPANPIAFPGETTQYFVTVTDGLCEISDSVIVAVQELPVLAFTTDTDCRSLLLTTANTSMGGFEFLWDFGDGTNPVPGDAPSHTYTVPGEYTVTLVSADGCDVQTSQTITVNIIDDPVDGEEISCFAEAVVLNPVSIPGYSYQWEPSEFLNNDTLGSPTAQVDVTTTFSVTITDPDLPGCSITEEIEVVVPPDFELNSQPDSAYCDAPTIVLTAGNSDVDYDWFNISGDLLSTGSVFIVTPQVETSYVVVGTDDFGCEKRDTFTLSPTFFNVESGPDVTICLGGDTSIFVTNNDPDQNLSYVWSPSNFIVPPSTVNDPTILVRPDHDQLFTVTITNDDLGCVTTEQVLVSVSTFMLEYTPSLLICRGESISLNVNNNDTTGLVFSWTPADQIDSGANTASPVVSPTETTVYTAHVIDTTHGCETDLSVTVNVSWFIPDLLEIYVNRDTVILGDTVFVLNTNQVDPLLDFLWSGHPGIEPNPTSHEITVTPTEGGGFSINLTVTNPDGCELNGSIALTVLDPPCDDSTVFVPDAFSPNNDGSNDEFEIYSNFIESMELHIYNRWGEEVFKSFDQSVKWDGTFKGEDCHPDVFGYYLKVICIPDKPFFKKGNVTLFR